MTPIAFAKGYIDEIIVEYMDSSYLELTFAFVKPHQIMDTMLEEGFICTLLPCRPTTHLGERMDQHKLCCIYPGGHLGI